VGVGYTAPTYKGSVHLDIGYAHYAGSPSVTHVSAGESYDWPHFRAYVALSVYRQTGIPSAWTWGTQGTLTYYSPYGHLNLSGGEGLSSQVGYSAPIPRLGGVPLVEQTAYPDMAHHPGPAVLP
ncbi:hypothetical protein, partial [Acidithiobacillus thiooxidans]|uniref:hypothetical protein n=1 Tax=Acidithiobacillus thiooxidans TaxID=930 RepID=UPI000AC66765